MNPDRNHIDWYLLIPVLGLMLFSIAFVYSASASIAQLKFGSPDTLFFNHSIRVFAGIITIIIFSRIDYHIWQKISKPLMFTAVFLLIFVLFAGVNIKGASRWIIIGSVSFQPSEFAKFILIIHFAALLASKKSVIKEFKQGFLPFVIWTSLICLLIAIQPNFSMMLLIFTIAFILMFIGNVNIIYLVLSAIAGSILAALYGLSSQYRMQRILGYLGLSESGLENTVNYQLNQSLLALGNGGIIGVGPGQNKQSHLFLPESYGDFIFSIIGEEYGFIGLIAIIACFVILLWRGIIITKNAPDDFAYFLSAGILISLILNFLVNASVNTGLIPTTGVPMPFVSYGGTAILFYSAALGILLNISTQAGVYPNKNMAENDAPT